MNLRFFAYLENSHCHILDHAGFHGMRGVQNNIDQNLLKHVGVGVNFGARLKVFLDFAADKGQLLIHKIDGLLTDLGQVGGS